MSESLPLKPLRPHTFLTLDALRGIAALAVISLHASWMIGHSYLQHAYLAVDFFFMLSGFVLTYAYQQRLDEGLSTFNFMKARLIRLYPLYLVATLAGFIYAIVTFLHTSQSGISRYLLHLLFSLFFIPSPPTGHFAGMAAFPYNSFAWSLFYELVANLVHAIFLRRRSTRTLLVLAILIGIGFFTTIIRIGIDAYGTLARDIPEGILRVLFCYLVGMLLYRLWSLHRDRRVISPIWAVSLLIATMYISASPQHNAAFDTLALLLALPTVVFLGAISRPSGLAAPVATVLGILSYAIYIFSAPTMIYASRAFEYFFNRPPDTLAPWSGIATVSLICVIAWFADAFYDIPVRRWLRKRYGS